MPKLTPKSNFILRSVEGQRTIAKKGIKIDVTDEEHKRLGNYFAEGFPAKKKA